VIPTGTRDESTVLFQGSRNGVSGIYARAITVVNGQLEPLSAPVELIKVGGHILSAATATVTGFTLYRPLNRIGRFAFTVTLSDGTTAIVAGALAQQNPVIFVPGIGGSTLVDLPPDGDEVWLGRILNRLNPPNRLRLTCFYEDTFWSPNIEATDAIRSKGYGAFLNYLKSKGYREQTDLGFPRTSNGCERAQKNDDPNLNPDLFVFAYDWRKDNHANAEKLGEYVQCVEQFYPDTKVDIVTHSMGVVLARRCLLRNPGNHNVDKLITIAAPWLGAPKLLHVLETGEWIREFGIAIAAGPDIKAIAPSLTAAHQLLPSRAYQSLGGAPILVEDGWDIDRDHLEPETYDYGSLNFSTRDIPGSN
jgi:pimeloyl-ACP methyl ester carboxylesterase